MLGKHSFIYFLGRGLPGIINFLALSIYTRLVAPDEYGKYSIIFATVMLLTMVLYQWIRVTLLRFLPQASSSEEENQLFSSVFIGFLVSGTLSLIALIIYLLFFNNKYSIILLGGGLLLLWLQSLYEIGLDYFRSNLKVTRYSIINFIRSVLALAFGTVFSYLGFGANGLILGLNISIIIIIGFYYRTVLSKMFKSIKFFNKKVFF